METVTILATIILPLLIGYVLGKNRDNSKTLFNKKLEIYSDIVYYLNSAKYLKLNLAVSVEKMKALIKEIDSLQENKSIESKARSYSAELEEVDKKMSLLNYRDELVKLFAPARLIGSKAVVNELRDYFSLISEYHSIEKKEDIDELSKKISKSAMELEQLMRKDLGYFRVLSRLKIWWYLHKN